MPYQPSPRRRTRRTALAQPGASAGPATGGAQRWAFSSDEWGLLVRLPGRVVVAATSAEADSPRRTVGEGLAGIEAIAAGRDSASALVRDIVAEIYHETDSPPAAEEYRDPAAGIADVLATCRAAAEVLAVRTGREDADAYRHWIEAVATRVCHAARGGDLLGFGGPPVSAAEWHFLAELAAAFDR
jgi:hypothetical protein